MNYITPSLFCSDPMMLKDQINELERLGVKWYHIDIMDGKFVRNFALGCEFTKKLKPHLTHPMYFHLMAVDPLNHVETLRNAGADALAFHFEAVNNPFLVISRIKACGMKAGIAINPITPVEALRPILPILDYVVIMSMEPGLLGQSFMPEAYGRISKLRSMIDECGSSALIEVDGAVNPEIGAKCVAAGADALVAGFAFVFDTAKPIEQHYLDFADCLARV